MNPAEVKIGHLLVIKLILQPPNILDVSSFVGFGGKATSRYLAAQSQLESAKLAFHEVDKHIFEWFLGMPWEIFMGCQWDFNIAWDLVIFMVFQWDFSGGFLKFDSAHCS